MKQCESNRIGSWRRALVGGIAVLVLATSAQHASAQAIVKQLIGNAVDEIGPQYADIEQAVKRFTDG
ncbi:MAG: hypothetical protein KDA60_03565, partial [Planctomycetales bacterium]|nr:hypothetical protein [Planctomycetales bacterium]